MNYKEFLQRFKEDQSDTSTKIKVLFGTATVLTVVLFGAVYFINGQGSRLAITEAEIQKQTAFINQFHLEERRFKAEHGTFAQPVPKNRIDDIQNDLIQRAESANLSVNSVNRMAVPASAPVSTKKADKDKQAPPAAGVEYELNLTGTWETSVRYIAELQGQAALISIRSLGMKPNSTSPLIDTAIKYKIYLE